MVDPLTTAAIGAGLGALGGLFGSDTKTTQRLDLAPASAQETLGSDITTEQLQNLRNMFQMGPGTKDITAGYQSQQDLAELLKQMQISGGLPSSQDLSKGQEFASLAFRPQQLELQQAMKDQAIQANRIAAQLGRPINDPIVQARLRQENVRQMQGLGAQRIAYGQELGMSLPGQRLNFAGQLANLQSGLASQALQNRQTLLSLGNQIQQQGQNFRIQSAGRTVTESSGGGLQGAITGLMGGAGAGLDFAGAMGMLPKNSTYYVPKFTMQQPVTSATFAQPSGFGYSGPSIYRQPSKWGSPSFGVSYP